jgi:hypothetical protein
MTKTHGVAIIALLAILIVVLVHRSYIRRADAPRFEYRATESPVIDLAALRRAGDEGWNCSPIPIFEGDHHHYVLFCRREIR